MLTRKLIPHHLLTPVAFTTRLRKRFLPARALYPDAAAIMPGENISALRYTLVCQERTSLRWMVI